MKKHRQVVITILSLFVFVFVANGDNCSFASNKKINSNAKAINSQEIEEITEDSPAEETEIVNSPESFKAKMEEIRQIKEDLTAKKAMMENKQIFFEQKKEELEKELINLYKTQKKSSDSTELSIIALKIKNDLKSLNVCESYLIRNSEIINSINSTTNVLLRLERKFEMDYKMLSSNEIQEINNLSNRIKMVAKKYLPDEQKLALNTKKNNNTEKISQRIKQKVEQEEKEEKAKEAQQRQMQLKQAEIERQKKARLEMLERQVNEQEAKREQERREQEKGDAERRKAERLTTEKLKNAEYEYEGVIFKFKNGEYSKGNSFDGFHAYFNTAILGDLNNDELEDALVLTTYNYGASGGNHEVYVMINKNGIPILLKRLTMNVVYNQSLQITSKGLIKIPNIIHGDLSGGSNFPDLLEIKFYKYDNNEIKEITDPRTEEERQEEAWQEIRQGHFLYSNELITLDNQFFKYLQEDTYIQKNLHFDRIVEIDKNNAENLLIALKNEWRISLASLKKADLDVIKILVQMQEYDLRVSDEVEKIMNNYKQKEK